MTISENIRLLRERYGKTQRELAQIAGVTDKAISTWETGANVPRMGAIQRIADHFGINKSDIIEEGGVNRLPAVRRPILIPVLGRVPAGVPLHAVEDIIDYEEIPESMARLGEHFALRIAGKSMEPRIVDGDVVIVRKQSDVDSGDVAIVLIDGEDATCKRIKKHEQGLTLISTNPAFEPVFFTHEDVAKKPVAILGKVVELRAKF